MPGRLSGTVTKLSHRQETSSEHKTCVRRKTSVPYDLDTVRPARYRDLLRINATSFNHLQEEVIVDTVVSTRKTAGSQLWVVGCALLFVVSLATDSNAQSWVARHGMTSAQYQSEFNTWTSQGFRLADVSGYDEAGTVRFAAIWVKQSGPAWVARHNMTSAQYQSQFNTWVGQGYRLVLVEGYESGGEARYAALWELKSGPSWVARHGMTSAQYQAEFNTWVGRGFRLKRVQGYAVAGTDYYAAIWEQTTGPSWVAHHGMTSGTYQGTFNAYVAQGYRLTHVSGYTVGGTDYYAAIWEKSAGPASVARHRMTSEQYQQAFSDLVNAGYRLKLVDGYTLDGSARYAAIWEAAR